MAIEMFISQKTARDWMSLSLLFTKKEKFARHLKKICKTFVKDLKYTHLIKIWNVFCVEGKYFKIHSANLNIWHLTFELTYWWCQNLIFTSIIWMYCKWYWWYLYWYWWYWHDDTGTGTEGTDSTSTDAHDIGTILSQFHWWILRLSSQLEIVQSVRHRHFGFKRC